MSGSPGRALSRLKWLLLLAAVACRPCLSRAGEQKSGGYEIIAHRARLQIFPEQNALACTDTLTIRSTAGRPDQIKLRLLPVYDVEGVWMNDWKSGFQRERDSIRLEDIPSDTVFRCTIRYSGQLAFRSEFSLLTKERAILREEEILPGGSSALELVRLSLEVPSAWEALSVGRLVRRDTVKDSVVTVWEMAKPIPMIGWICAGKYWSKGNDSAGIPVSVHLFNEDSAAAPEMLSLAGEVLRFYSERFSPYRFSDLKIVEVDDWVAGGNVLAVATPGMVMIKRLAMRTEDRFNRFSAILPHEVAHQWWPLTVFIGAEDAALLSEGMCDYSAMLFNEARGKLSIRDSLKHHPLLRPLMLRVEKGLDVPLQGKADLRALPTHYLKAAYVHNMLRRILGDSVFFRLYREYARRFETRKAGLEDFQRLAEELSGKKLDWFFQQWVRKRGIPRIKIYNVAAAPAHDGEGWITHGRVRIVGYDRYTVYVSVGVHSSSGTVTASVWLGMDSTGRYRNDAPFEVTSPSKPDYAVLDPDGNVLKMQKLPVKFSDVREPSDGLIIVGTRKHAAHLMELAQKDSAEMAAALWSVTIKRDWTVTLGDLQNERVFLYGNATENSTAADLASRFPVRFRGDSVVVARGFVKGKSATGGDSALSAGEAIFDSTLALLQCIESPYIAHGFLAWIAPLSELATPSLLPYDASWTLVRGKDEIGSGTWEVRDEENFVEIK